LGYHGVRGEVIKSSMSFEVDGDEIDNTAGIQCEHGRTEKAVVGRWVMPLIRIACQTYLLTAHP
jgi:hypothetical protein